MTQEKVERVLVLNERINKCEDALQFMTHGTFNITGDNQYLYHSLPKELCEVIREDIVNYLNQLNRELEEL